jgi:hypothetical protein
MTGNYWTDFLVAGLGLYLFHSALIGRLETHRSVRCQAFFPVVFELSPITAEGADAHHRSTITLGASRTGGLRGRAVYLGRHRPSSETYSQITAFICLRALGDFV